MLYIHPWHVAEVIVDDSETNHTSMLVVQQISERAYLEEPIRLNCCEQVRLAQKCGKN